MQDDQAYSTTSPLLPYQQRRVKQSNALQRRTIPAAFEPTVYERQNNHRTRDNSRNHNNANNSDLSLSRSASQVEATKTTATDKESSQINDIGV